VRARCPGVDLGIGPSVELRSRPSPPAIRIVTTGPDFNQPSQSISSTSSPIFALSPASTCATPVSFEFSSPGVSPGYLQPMSPFTFSDVGPSPTPSPGPSSPLLLPRDTLPHEVGLLSLSASEEAKYVGSSSGISFARMVFADSGGVDLQKSDEDLRDFKRHIPSSTVEPIQLPKMDDCLMLSKSYFETVHLQYPFLHQPTFDGCLQAVYYDETTNLPPNFSLATARFHVLLVLSIGEHIVSTRSGRHRDLSEGYHAAALLLSNNITLTGSLQGAQSSLLLAMQSLYAMNGWNVWYLNAIIMATCVDLGLHRKVQDVPGDQCKAALRRRVFWSAYNLDRSLGVALGRPFSIRDESFDVEFPHDTDNDEELSNLPLGTRPPTVSQSIGTSRASFSYSIYIFRIIKILSKIKVMIYQVSPSTPSSWNADLPGWQMEIYRQLLELQEQIRTSLGGMRRASGSCSGQLTGGQLAELKLHEAIQLLFRPSPIFPRPTAYALQLCFNSAVEAIRIYNKPKRYSEPLYPYTRLTEYSIFLSGITMLYCHRTCREVQDAVANDFLAKEIQSCSFLLADLAQHWPTAQKSRARFDALAHSTLAYSSATASSRMLSPHDGPRRSSGGSVRSFADSHTLEVPSMATALGSSPSSHGSVSEWYGAGVGMPPAGGGGGGGGGGGDQGVDIGWMQNQSWDLQMAPEDIMISGMEETTAGAPADMDIMENLMTGDTTMWGMDSSQQQQQQQQR